MTARFVYLATLLATSLGLAGCWPELMTARPKALITVKDAAGAPVAGVRVNLGTYSRFAKPPDLADYYTDKDGKLKIKRDLKWEIQVPLPDAMVYYGWDLCISKAGYKAVYLHSLDFHKPIDVQLEVSASPSECYRRIYQPPVVVAWVPGAWIQVEGGDWDPSGPNLRPIDDITDGLQEHATLHARSLGYELRPWSEYLFQYQGRLTNTTRYVHINAICAIPKEVDLRANFYTGSDVAACRFEATYDVVRGRFDGFEMRPATAAN